MKKRIFLSTCAIALASLLLLGAGVVALVYQEATRSGWENLRADTSYMAAGYQMEGVAYLAAIRGYPGRVTLVAADGTVLFDDREDPAAMGNHSDRPEIQQALQNGTGRDTRQSETLGERTLYYAQRLPDGAVLRLALRQNSIAAEVSRFVPWLAVICLLLVAAALAAANWQTGRIVAPINNIDLNNPFDEDAYEELSPLLRRIAAQKEQIDHKVEALRRAQEEFSTITQSMEEGLIVTDHAGMVLTVNQSALRILDVMDAPPTPLPVLALGRNLVLEEAAQTAADGSRFEAELAAAGRRYRLVASPTRNQNGEKGAVLLLMDDTEKLEAEQSRREFSANVSHELKTPLTSISGYAEIMRDGMVKTADIPGFAGKIYDEAGRLIALVEDVIKLSRLDEKQIPLEREPVELLALAWQTAASLEAAAAQKDVTVAVLGQEASVSGVRSILLEVLYNLVENAVRYNVPGGRVSVEIKNAENGAVIEVTDSGIGIRPEFQSHIFERFYRVDKSHSRDSGGTGLGLSIVKRGTLFHGGTVDVRSAMGKGSVFTVWLPKK